MLRKKAKEVSPIDQDIADVREQMKALTADDPAYAKCVEQYQNLMKIKASNSPDRVTFKDWIPVIGTLSAVLVIVTFEAFGHSMTSKAMSFAPKPKA